MNSGSYCVILDSNIWVTERLLHTSIGSAFLYSLAGSDGTIVLPEIVETEVTSILLDQGEKAVAEIARAARLLRQMSGHTLNYTAPTIAAMKEGIANRWQQLTGRLQRTAFTFDHAKAALQRIYDAKPPCRQNNEQFRDCCIWEVAKLGARTKPVHLITADAAFFEARGTKREFSEILKREVQAEGLDLSVHATLGEFLNVMNAVSPKLDPNELQLAYRRLPT
jgi:hypothetical protein